ncbi:MAG TPA: hypothetical protein VEK56_06910 [Vicinamibacterales bacterium]|nr:hypothetical protein [Vicinamibacterales bacterium]
MTDARDRDFLELRHVVKTSAPGRALVAILRQIQDWADRSMMLTFARARFERYRGLTRAERLGGMGAFLLAFAITYFVLALLLPLRSAPALPALLSGPVACVGLVLVAMWSIKRKRLPDSLHR